MTDPRAAVGPLIPVALAVVLLAGCSGDDGRVVVRGRLLENGQPFVLDAAKLKLPAGATALPPGSRPLQITFTPEAGGDPSAAVVDAAAGTFELLGPDRKGVKPGRYKVAVTASAGPGSPDLFGGKFAPDQTPLVREVKPGEEVVIDLAKP